MRTKIIFKKPLWGTLLTMTLGIFMISSVNAQVDVKKDKEDSQTTAYPMNHPMSSVFSGSARVSEAEKQNTPNNQRVWCSSQDVDRTENGRCNNTSAFSRNIWGSTHIPLLRAIPAVYTDSSYNLVGQNRKNPREISNIIFESDCGPSSSRLSSFVFSWGQFLDHDISVSPESEEESESVPIPPVNGDIITDSIPFHRSETHSATGIRQQSNILTAWIDGSNVYGSDVTRANYLRSFVDGKLKVSTSPNGDLLPWNTDNNEENGTLDLNAPFMAGDKDQAGNPVKVYVAGDIRANEQTGLTSLHTLFMREHNRICDQLIVDGMTSDEAIYQRARKEVGAIIQSITYNEFLPALGVQMPTYGGYDDEVRPDIMNVFSTAAYRLGHTMVTEHLLLYDDNGNNTGNLSLAEAFFNPTFVLNNGIEGVLNGLAQQFQEETDAEIVENLRSFLFTPTPTGPGLDLAALNIQRGRDHGLDDYNAFRLAFTGTLASNFSNITSDPVLQEKLEEAYDDNVNNIDVWVGLLAEDRLPNAAIGETLNAILADQFTKLRDGDFYFYKHDPEFSNTEVNIIHSTTLSDVIKRNTNINNIKNQVFYAPCPSSKNLTTSNNILNNGVQVHKSVNTITATNVIDNTSNAVYDAGLEITLLPGFDTSTGTEFHALINGCDSDGFNRVANKKIVPEYLSQAIIKNSPNPFSESTTIEYNLPQENLVSISIHDINGKEVANLLDNQLVAEGTHDIEFAATNLANGIYYCIMQVGEEQKAIKLNIQK